MNLWNCLCGWHAGRRRVMKAALTSAAVLATPMLGRGARAQTTAPGAGRPRTINAHAHYFPQAWLDLVRTEGKAYGMEYHLEGDRLTVGGPPGRTPLLPPGITDLRARLADMDAQGVDVHAMSLTTPMLYWAPPELSARLARVWNDGAAEAHAQYPDRLFGLMALPMLDADMAIAELERAKSLPGMRGVYMGTNINSIDLADKRFLPIFKAIEAAGLPVFLHPVQTVGGARLQPFYLGNIIGNPLETGIAAANLIIGGVLDACPRLSVNLPHAGGVVPILTGRWDHAFHERAELRHMPRPPSEYLKRFTYDTIAHSPAVMRFVIDQVGIERIVLGDDYCFDMGYARPVQFVDELGLSPADRAKVLGGNAAALLNI